MGSCGFGRALHRESICVMGEIERHGPSVLGQNLGEKDTALNRERERGKERDLDGERENRKRERKR